MSFISWNGLVHWKSDPPQIHSNLYATCVSPCLSIQRNKETMLYGEDLQDGNNFCLPSVL
jgi:hypothetical protein